jgi:hypothetical protein
LKPERNGITEERVFRLSENGSSSMPFCLVT